jgi:hypothetical protein
VAIFTVLAAPAMAQVCNGTNTVVPLGSLTGKIPGDSASPTAKASVRYAFGNDVTSDCGNGPVSQLVHQVIVQPSCNLVAGACVNDPGGDDGDPTTPAVEFLSLDATTCTGGLGNITVDSSDPFAVRLNFTVPLSFAPNTGCSVDVTLHVRERGNGTTTNTIAQQYSTDGACQCDPELSSSGATSSQLFLTCPPCSTNFCAPELCNATTVQCDAQPLPDCSNPDNDLCTSGSCDPTASGGDGACVNGPRTVCPNSDNDLCTAETCNAATGNCDTGPRATCSNSDNDLCTTETCNAATGNCDTGPRTTCPNSDNDLCTAETCNAATGHCDTGPRTTCPNSDDDLCTAETCNAATGHCDTGARTVCENDTCQVCEASSGDCINRDPLPTICTPALGCRLTGGGIVCDPKDPDSACTTDPTTEAEIQKATFGGQVGAPYVIGGCNLDNFDCIQGEWTHMRHNGKGTFHASEYNSMICRCVDAEGNDVLPVGQLCNPCHGPDCHADDYPGPEPRPAPANVACFSGKGLWKPTPGRRQIPVAFRVEWEDRGEPGAGQNAGNLEDVYRIRIWIPNVSPNKQDDEATRLAVAACCSNTVDQVVSAIGLPDVNDGGNLTHGNLQIHPQTGNPNNNSTCPVQPPE